MGSIKQWKTRKRKEGVYAPHNARPLTAALERHVEAGAYRVEFCKVRGSQKWELEALYYEEAK